ncbi:unnamed protein product [Phaedon cochleariae]|uniref:Uncharacterized protein n=1 Tax=Phaedon cochleariae TaxID=80249 RepID=A0A9P0DL13_PHACE|nr:unnamed protein product [Phaedon cochleariae]
MYPHGTICEKKSLPTRSYNCNVDQPPPCVCIHKEGAKVVQLPVGEMNCVDYSPGVHELSGVRLPLQPYQGGHAVFMYSTASDGNVTLQLKEPDDLDRNSLAAMLARLQDDATFSISYQDTDILAEGIDVLLGSGTANSSEYDI